MSFDPRAPGAEARAWTARLAAQPMPELDLAAYGRVVVVSAHPDDETLGAGGLIAASARRGMDVEILVVTDGAASHPDSPTHAPETLRSLRRRETERAIAILAPGAIVRFLDVADGATADARDAIASAVRPLVTADALLVAPYRGDGHRDHRIVGEVCADVAEEVGCDQLEYPIWYWHWASPDADLPWEHAFVHRLDHDARAAKHAAIRQHGSQTAALGPEPGNEALLTPAFLEHFGGDSEVFVAAAPAGETLSRAYFDARYARTDDPWSLATRAYESRKRAITVSSLPLERYGNALEIGCSIGMLTAEFAPRCDALLAVDISAAAVDSARRRTADLGSSVRVEQHDVTLGLPQGKFDLIVLSEVGYYLARTELAALARRVRAALSPDGTVVACHWRHPVRDYPLSGDAVHEILRAELGLPATVEHRERDFLLEVFETRPRSLAQREGLVE